jgi:hypothetical protein
LDGDSATSLTGKLASFKCDCLRANGGRIGFYLGFHFVSCVGLSAYYWQTQKQPREHFLFASLPVLVVQHQ